MPDGGGGGGDGGASQREAAERARRADAIDQINAYFGMDPAQKTVKRYEDGTAPDPNAKLNPFTQQPESRGHWVETPGNGLNGPAGHMEPDKIVDVTNPLIDTSKTNAAARNKLYDSTRQNVLDLNLSNLKDWAEQAKRQQSFGLARRGLTGSSQEIDAGKEFQRTYDKSSSDAATTADAAALDFKTSDEKSRLNLLDQVNSGADASTALQNSINQLTLNADAATTGAKGRVINNTFGNIAQQYAYGPALAGDRSALARWQAARGLAPSNSGYAGTVT